MRTETLGKIRLDMDAAKNRREADAKRSREVFLRENPRLAELIGEKRNVLLKLLDPDVKEEEKKQIRDRVAAVDGMIAEKYGEDWEKAFEVKPICGKCNDEGYVYSNGRRTMCKCLTERVFKEIYGGEDIDALEGSFDSFEPDVAADSEQKKSLKGTKKLLEQSLEEGGKDYIVMLGQSGLGKTFALSALAKELKKREKSVLFIKSTALFDVFHAERLGEDVPVRPIFSADALIIDDLGTEPMTANVTRESLFRLIEERGAAGRLTAISSNLSMDQLKERYTEKVSSRLFAGNRSLIIRLSGRDIRLKRSK